LKYRKDETVVAGRARYANVLRRLAGEGASAGAHGLLVRAVAVFGIKQSKELVAPVGEPNKVIVRGQPATQFTLKLFEFTLLGIEGNHDLRSDDFACFFRGLRGKWVRV
jgi:hypothetical protein